MIIEQPSENPQLSTLPAYPSFGKEQELDIFVLFIYSLTKKSFTMNKGDLINKVATEAGLSKAQAGKALDSVINTVQKSLKKGDKVTLVGFGTWSVAKRSARVGRNPQTGAAIKIPAKKVVKFKAGKDFAKTV